MKNKHNFNKLSQKPVKEPRFLFALLLPSIFLTSVSVSCIMKSGQPSDLAGFWMKNEEIGLIIKYESATKDSVRTMLLTGIDGQPRGANRLKCSNSDCVIGDAEFTYFKFRIHARDQIEALIPIISDVDGDGGKYEIIKKGDILRRGVHHVYDKAISEF